MKRIKLFSFVFFTLATKAFAQAPATFLVNVIPASAKFAQYLTLNPQHPTMTPDEAVATGKNLEQALPQLRQAAQKFGANLIVLLGSEHGIAVPIGGLARPLVLRGDNPVITAVLFRWAGAPSPTDSEKSVHFTTSPVPDDKQLKGDTVMKINYSISLKSAPPGTELGTWVYLNISRFVADAVHHDFDTISLRSTDDPSFQNVWLPGCDAPLKVSRKNPELDVTIFRKPGTITATK